MGNPKDILPGREERLTDDDLLRFLSDEISPEEKELFESKLSGSFEADAVEGLQQIKDKETLQSHVNELHKKLPRLLRADKQRFHRKQIHDLHWMILTLLILLFLCIVTYVIIGMHQNNLR